MGKTWDGGDIAFRPETWRLVFDAMKPGAHLAAFGGSRGYHRMACAIEDAGFEIRDSLMWIYGTGFPKSHNLGNGWGSALKPAFEPIVLARKPMIGTIAANVALHGVGALNIDACRVGSEERTYSAKGTTTNAGMIRVSESKIGVAAEPVTVSGRWPANVLHDGSDEVVEAFAAFGEKKAGIAKEPKNKQMARSIYGETNTLGRECGFADAGTAARFFYCAKASKSDRAGSSHPTVKPLSLMRWLCTLITPPGGTILDPFSGSGSTLQAAAECGFHAIGIEREAEYFADIVARLNASIVPEVSDAVAQLDMFA
jgi:site-specific DNA-methyltransferase (adenine-specific)